jgi:hypothetical protein
VLDRGYTNFNEKALFVKLTWRPRCVAERSSWGPSRYASGQIGAEEGPELREAPALMPL